MRPPPPEGALYQSCWLLWLLWAGEAAAILYSEEVKALGSSEVSQRSPTNSDFSLHCADTDTSSAPSL